MTIAIRDDLTYQKELVESPPARSGEFKIRLFINPILGILGRGRYQTVNCPRSTVEGGTEFLPPLVAFQEAANLTEKGRKLLQKMETNPPKSLHQEGSAVPIASKDMPFLEKVMVNGHLEDIFDARDITAQRSFTDGRQNPATRNSRHLER